MAFSSFLAGTLMLLFQLVQATEHLKFAATDPAYPLKASAQASLALALAHSRNIPAAVDACRVALTLNSRNEHAASLWLLLMSVLESADDVMELASSLKSQLPNSVLLNFVIAGLQVAKMMQALSTPHHLNNVSCRLPWDSMSSALFHART